MRLALPTFELLQIANHDDDVDVAEFDIAGTRVLLQVRHHGGIPMMRVLTYRAGAMHEGEWMDFGGRGIQLEWSMRGKDGDARLETALNAAR